MGDKTIDNSGSTPASKVVANTSGASSAPPEPIMAGSKESAAQASDLPAADKKLVWIELDHDDDLSSNGLTVMHNGNAYTIPSDGPAHVEEFLLGVLDGSRYSYKRVSAPKKGDEKADDQ